MVFQTPPRKYRSRARCESLTPKKNRSCILPALHVRGVTRQLKELEDENRLLRENLAIMQKKEERGRLQIRRMGKVIAALVSRLLFFEHFMKQERRERAKNLEELEQKVSFLQESLGKEKESVELALANAASVILPDSARCKQGSSATVGRQVRRREKAMKGRGADTVLGEEKVDEKEKEEDEEEVEEEEEDEEEEDSGRESDDHREAETEAQEEGKEEEEEERKNEEQDEKVKVETVWQKMDICNCAFCGVDKQKNCPVQWSQKEGRVRGVEDFEMEPNGKLQKVIQFSYWTHGL